MICPSRRAEGYFKSIIGSESGCSMSGNAEAEVLMNSGRADKWSENNPERLTKEQARKKASFDREQAIEEGQRVDAAKRAEKRAAEEPERLTKEQARKKASFDREQAIEEGQKARKLKTGKHLPE
jgi:hypothetical protein